MQTERKYRVDKYLEMARLTKSIDKKESFIDMAHYYLEVKEFDVTNDDHTHFFDNLEKEEIIGRPRQEIYDDYVEFCKENGEILVSRAPFYRELEKHYGVHEHYPRTKNKNGEKIRARVYY